MGPFRGTGGCLCATQGDRLGALTPDLTAGIGGRRDGNPPIRFATRASSSATVGGEVTIQDRDYSAG